MMRSSWLPAVRRRGSLELPTIPSVKVAASLGVSRSAKHLSSVIVAKQVLAIAVPVTHTHLGIQPWSLI